MFGKCSANVATELPGEIVRAGCRVPERDRSGLPRTPGRDFSNSRERSVSISFGVSCISFFRVGWDVNGTRKIAMIRATVDPFGDDHDRQEPEYATENSRRSLPK